MFKLKLVQKIVQAFNTYKKNTEKLLNEENPEILLDKGNKIIAKVDKIKSKEEMKNTTEKEQKERDKAMEEIAKENDAKELFNLYQKILALIVKVQGKQLEEFEEQQEGKYSYETATLKSLINELNNINNEILNYDPKSNEHYMITTSKNIYKKLSDAGNELKNLKKTCNDKGIDIKKIPKYMKVKDTNSTVGKNLKKIEEEYFGKKNKYIDEDKKRRDDIYKNKNKNNLTKYKKGTTTNVPRSTYVKTLYNIPFLSEYNGFNDVFIPFAFELPNNYINIFPENMKTDVNSKLKSYGKDGINMKIFFCYQYIAGDKKLINNKRLLFRPHFFIAKKEIDSTSDTLSNKRKNVYDPEDYKDYTTYNEIQKRNDNKIFNTCIFYDSEHCIINEDINNFSVHDGCLSFMEPTVEVIPGDENKINKTYVYYSFVLEQKKKIAALTIHFLCFPKTEECISKITTAMFGINKFYKNNKTIESAINFAKDNGDEEVVKFLNYITDDK